jgi:branched-chain amino acid transport system permease protein
VFLQTLVTGLSIGGIYALMAVGYSLVFSVLNFSNFAHGSVIMLGAYIGLGLVFRFHSGLAFVVVGAMIGAAIIAMVNEKLAYTLLRRRKAPSLYLMISAMGVSVFLENLVYATIGSRFYAYPEFFSQKAVCIGTNCTLSLLDIMAFFISLASIMGLHLFMTRTKTGIAIRAGVSDMTMCSLMGVNLDRLISVVFLLAGLFGGIAGVFLGIKYLVYPTMGWVTNKAYIAAVIGGLGSLPGALVGGLILGVLETFVSSYVSSVMRDVFSFGLLIALLVWLPNGLFGRESGEKV